MVLNFNLNIFIVVNIVDLLREPELSDLQEKIKGGSEYHDFYYDTCSRADIMSMFYNAADVDKADTEVLKKILPQSAVESSTDYDSRLERTPVIPFEKMFVRSKERIFQGHGVKREFPETSNDFWENIQKRFDDQGDGIDKFFRNKAFHYKEVLGFAGIVVDLLTQEVEDEEGNIVLNTYADSAGEPVPYTYLVRPHEIYDYEVKQGYLQYLIIKQKVERDEFDYKYTIYTPQKVYVFGQIVTEDGEEDFDETVEELLLDSTHPFGQVPFVFLKGEQDIDSAFKIGRPERYSLLHLYRMAIEIGYDLQEVSLLYAHPIPVLSESQVKELIGSIGDDGKYNPENISAQLGAVVQVPDGSDFPDKLFFQSDTSGLDHLKDYLFEIIDVVHKFAAIRDKTQVISNVSGVAKALDTVEERGVLASSSREMELIEHEVLSLFTAARSDVEFNDEMVQYQKEFDLSTASEHMDVIIEGSSNNALTFELYKYHTLEGLRKSGAPQSKVDEVEEKLDEFGKPIKASIQELVAVINKGDRAFTESVSKQVKILEHFLERNKEHGTEAEKTVEETNPLENESEEDETEPTT